MFCNESLLLEFFKYLWNLMNGNTVLFSRKKLVHIFATLLLRVGFLALETF